MTTTPQGPFKIVEYYPVYDDRDCIRGWRGTTLRSGILVRAYAHKLVAMEFAKSEAYDDRCIEVQDVKGVRVHAPLDAKFDLPCPY